MSVFSARIKCQKLSMSTQIRQEKSYCTDFGHGWHNGSKAYSAHICGTACSVYLCRWFALPPVLWCCWLGGRKGIQPVKHLSGEVLARCRLAYGPVDATATHCLLLQRNPDWLLPFWYWLTRVVSDKGPLNGCVCLRCVTQGHVLCWSSGGGRSEAHDAGVRWVNIDHSQWTEWRRPGHVWNLRGKTARWWTVCSCVHSASLVIVWVTSSNTSQYYFIFSFSQSIKLLKADWIYSTKWMMTVIWLESTAVAELTK